MIHSLSGGVIKSDEIYTFIKIEIEKIANLCIVGVVSWIFRGTRFLCRKKMERYCAFSADDPIRNIFDSGRDFSALGMVGIRFRKRCLDNC